MRRAPSTQFRASNSLMEGTGYQAAEARFTHLTAQIAEERNRLSELTARLTRVEGVIRNILPPK